MARQNSAGSRDKYRDNDDVRNPTASDDRNEVRPDTRDEARGDARDNVGRNARGTDAAPTGPEDNDKTKRERRDQDEFQGDLERR
jgi:hypothetical protein